MRGDLTFSKASFSVQEEVKPQQLKIRLGQMLSRRRQQMIAGYRLIDCGQKQRAKITENTTCFWGHWLF